jgi:hypothetical protein
MLVPDAEATADTSIAAVFIVLDAATGLDASGNVAAEPLNITVFVAALAGSVPVGADPTAPPALNAICYLD